MAVDLSDAFDELAEPDYWTDVGFAFLGYIAAMALKVVVEDVSGQNLPNEVYGVAVAGGGLAMGQEMASVGGALHAVNNLAANLGVHNAIENMAAGNGGGA